MRRAALMMLCLGVAACDDMTSQPKKNAYADAAVAPGPVPAGTVEFGEQAVAAPPVTAALLVRGQERFRIDCTPCHSELGNGNGMIVQRGFPPPPSYHIARLREAPPTYLYDVITNGHGAMYGFAQRVAPGDRWAIVAYIRALQRSQDVNVSELTDAQRAQLK